MKILTILGFLVVLGGSAAAFSLQGSNTQLQPAGSLQNAPVVLQGSPYQLQSAVDVQNLPIYTLK